MFVSFWRELPAENSQHFWKSNNVKRRSLTSYYFSNKTYLWRVEMYRWLETIISIKRIICLRSFSNLLKNFVIVQIVYLEMKYKLLLYYKISPDINMINIGNKHFNVLLDYCWRVDDFLWRTVKVMGTSTSSVEYERIRANHRTFTMLLN